MHTSYQVLIQGFSRVYRSRKYSNRCIKGHCALQFGRANEGNGARHDAAFRFADTIATHLRRLHIPLKWDKHERSPRCVPLSHPNEYVLNPIVGRAIQIICTSQSRAKAAGGIHRTTLRQPVDITNQATRPG